MGRHSATDRHLRNSRLFLAVVILELLVVSLLLLYAPATIVTVELLGPLFGFLIQILTHA